jgi:FkbM family methyltransferase
MIRQKIGSLLKKLFPQYLFSTRSFAQDGEDVLLYAFFKYKKRGYKGFYVDIGAHHPFRFSNTALFYRKGWKGINIEPTTHLIDLFYKHRKRDINLQAAVSDHSGSLTFFEFNEPALNGFDEKLSLERASMSQYQLISKRDVPVFTLKEILDKHLPENQRIDFFTIDVEGHDLNILKSNDWEKYKPFFILIEGEFNSNNAPDNDIHQFLDARHYRIVGMAKRTLLYRLSDAIL